MSFRWNGAFGNVHLEHVPADETLLRALLSATTASSMSDGPTTPSRSNIAQQGDSPMQVTRRGKKSTLDGNQLSVDQEVEAVASQLSEAAVSAHNEMHPPLYHDNAISDDRCSVYGHMHVTTTRNETAYVCTHCEGISMTHRQATMHIREKKKNQVCPEPKWPYKYIEGHDEYNKKRKGFENIGGTNKMSKHEYQVQVNRMMLPHLIGRRRIE